MLEQRKADHIRINLEEDVGFDQLTTGLERFRFTHHALPELNLADIDLSISFFGKLLRVPLLISSMTGGTERAHIINRTLATAAQEAGIAMGLMKEDDQVAILTDIAGEEDHHGDMDFKVAGTAEGITALQMDVKVAGLSRDIMERALQQAREARLYVLDVMNKTLAEPRAELSRHAPRIVSIQINPDRIKDVIGPLGKNIKSIIDRTG